MSGGSTVYVRGSGYNPQSSRKDSRGREALPGGERGEGPLDSPPDRPYPSGMKKNTRRLKLTKETLVELQAPAMGQVAGGESTLPACPPTATDPTTVAGGC